jgi:flagellar hook-associated protein 2
LASAIKADPTTVAQLAANVGEAYDTAVGRMTGSGGPISIATNGLTSTINDFKARQEKLQLRLDAIESRYRAQFSALDKLVSSLTSTGDFLSSFISSLQPNK